MIYAQFYQMGLAVGDQPAKLIPATGDRSVIVLDGRERQHTWVQITQEECHKRGYKAWQLFWGDNVASGTPCTPIYYNLVYNVAQDSK